MTCRYPGHQQSRYWPSFLRYCKIHVNHNTKLSCGYLRIPICGILCDVASCNNYPLLDVKLLVSPDYQQPQSLTILKTRIPNEQTLSFLGKWWNLFPELVARCEALAWAAVRFWQQKKYNRYFCYLNRAETDAMTWKIVYRSLCWPRYQILKMQQTYLNSSEVGDKTLSDSMAQH